MVAPDWLCDRLIFQAKKGHTYYLERTMPFGFANDPPTLLSEDADPSVGIKFAQDFETRLD